MADTEKIVEEERQRFLKSILSRGPHKRRIKPAENTTSLQFALDDDSEDEDFEVPDCEPASDEEEEEDDIESNQESEESDSNSEAGPIQGSTGTLTVEDFIEAMAKSPPFKGHAGSVTSRDGAQGSKQLDIMICGVCLDDISDEGDEIVECDNCGITVHEGCYGINDEDDNSGKSSDTDSPTEVWFCDSCRAREKPPDCELCPNRGGIFKETDSGQWVHLLCALYTPGVAFVKPEKLESVTLSELTPYRWGAKDCDLCEDERFSRTGICVSCDAGLCRTYFHITCAQMHGLLSEVPEECHEDVADPLYAHCKLHADKKATASRRRAWMAYQSRYKKREERVSTEDKARLKNLLREARRQFQEHKKKDNAKPYTPTEKVPHLLSSCPGACRQLFKKAELLGFVTKQNHSVVNVRRKWFVAPGLTCEFVNYYHDRDHRVKEMSERQQELLSSNKLLHDEEQRCLTHYYTLKDEVQGFSTAVDSLRDESRLLHRVLCDVGNQEFSLPDTLEIKQDEPVVSGLPAKAIAIHQCFTCKKTDNQHKMVDCDTCKNFYHLACVDPPLTRMPKKSATCLWQCSECDSSDEEEDMDVDVSDNTPISQSRQRRTIKEPAKFTPDKLELSKRIRRKRKSGDLPSELENAKKKAKVQSKQTSKKSRVTYVRIEKVVDKRSECSHCGKAGDNSTLVRCDNCKLCYHFGCLDPPVKSNPKKRGYMWYCTDCDESEEESEEEERATGSGDPGTAAEKLAPVDDKRDSGEKGKTEPERRRSDEEETVADEAVNTATEVTENGKVKQEKGDSMEGVECKGKAEDGEGGGSYVSSEGEAAEGREGEAAARDGNADEAKKRTVVDETSGENLVKDGKEKCQDGSARGGKSTDGSTKADEGVTDSDIGCGSKGEEKSKREKPREQGQKKGKEGESSERQCKAEESGTEDASKKKKSGAEETPKKKKSGAEETSKKKQAGAEESSKKKQTGAEETPKKKQTGAEETPKKKQAGTEETSKKKQTETEETPKKKQTGAEETSKKKQTGAEDTPKKKQAGTEETPKKKQTGAEETPKKKQTGAEGTLKKKQTGAEETPKEKQTGEEETPKKKQTGAEDTPKKKQAGTEETPKKKQTGAEDTPKKKQTGAEETLKKKQTGAEETPKKKQAGTEAAGGTGKEQEESKKNKKKEKPDKTKGKKKK